MDRLILSERLESLRRCVARVEQHRKGNAEELVADIDAQDIIALNLTRVIQLCVDVAVQVLADGDQPAPATMGEAFTLVANQGVISAELASRLRAAVGFRNLAVHGYHRIDWHIVHRLTHEGLEDLRTFAREVGSRLD
jgi:uncharacterized protein YutE (UPF0331/DUF86 family)